MALRRSQCSALFQRVFWVREKIEVRGRTACAAGPAATAAVAGAAARSPTEGPSSTATPAFALRPLWRGGRCRRPCRPAAHLPHDGVAGKGPCNACAKVPPPCSVRPVAPVVLVEVEHVDQTVAPACRNSRGVQIRRLHPVEHCPV